MSFIIVVKQDTCCRMQERKEYDGFVDKKKCFIISMLHCDFSWNINGYYLLSKSTYKYGI